MKQQKIAGIRVVFGAVILCLFSSCSKEGADVGYLKGKFRLEFATVLLNQSSPYLICDNGDTLISDTIQSFRFNHKEGQRVVANYTPDEGEGEGLVFHSIVNVTTSTILTTTRTDTLHQDALASVQSIWTGGGYLNMILLINSYSKVHRFGLYRTASSPNELILSHNKNGDSEGYPIRVYLSFLLSGFHNNSNPDSTFFSVTVPLESGSRPYLLLLPK